MNRLVSPAILGAVALDVVATAAGGSPYDMRVLTIAGIYAIAALGYQFIFGHAGALSLAQGAFMGLGAYAAALAPLPVSVVAPAVLAAVVAVPVRRLQTHYFALATLIVGQIAVLVATGWVGVTGGANGLFGIPALPVGPGRPTLIGVWCVVAVGAALLAWILHGRRAAACDLMRRDPRAAAAIGLDTARLRFGAFVMSAAYAGAAGGLYARTLGVISPDVLGFPLMVTILTIAVVGSRRRIAGAVAGAVVVTGLPEWVRFLRDDYLLAYGVVLLAMIVLCPDGLAVALERVLPPPRARSVIAAESARGYHGKSLSIRGLGRRFGGVAALRDVSLDVGRGEILGLIGPNGSGKTTLLNAVTGIFPAQSGTIALDGADITRLPPHRLARAGLARTFQTPILIDDRTALDNVALAAAASWTDARSCAAGLLCRLGMEVGVASCGSLAPGTRRRVELARALAAEPAVLLLDEPAAGLAAGEQAALRRVLRELADGGLTMIVVDHNLGFLGPLADRIACLDAGRVIAVGTPAEVQAHPDVIAAYLGR